MDLFHFQEEAPGSVFWHPKGWTLFQTLENYIRRRQADAGYAEVNAPQLIDLSLRGWRPATWRHFAMQCFWWNPSQGGLLHLRAQADELPRATSRFSRTG